VSDNHTHTHTHTHTHVNTNLILPSLLDVICRSTACRPSSSYPCNKVKGREGWKDEGGMVSREEWWMCVEWNKVNGVCESDRIGCGYGQYEYS
jgi:hypothetical protein